ncbi:hypothetical protein, partial [Burkholderia stabilis]
MPGQKISRLSCAKRMNRMASIPRRVFRHQKRSARIHRRSLFMRTERNYVNGGFVVPESDAFIVVHNPATE